MSDKVENSTFERNYLRCAASLEATREALMWIGMREVSRAKA